MIRHKPILVAILLSILTLPLVAAPVANPQTAALVERIRKNLPVGWTVKQEANDILIERNTPALMLGTAPNPPTGEKPTMGTVSMMLRVYPNAGVKELTEWTKLNMDKATALEMMQTQMKDIPAGRTPSRYIDGYHATNPDQQKRLDAYEAVGRNLPEYQLPTMWAKEGGLYWRYDVMMPTEQAVQTEFEKVKESITSLFNPTPVN